MGLTNSKRVLVIMTNGDVYYVSSEGAEQLITSLATGEPTTEVRDVKSGASVTLNLRNVSSIVEEVSRG